MARHLSRLDTGRTHPTGAGGDWGWVRGGQKAHAPNWCGRKLRLGPRRGEGVPHQGECACQAPGCLSRSDGEGTIRRRSLLFRAFLEHPRAGTACSAGHAPYRTAGSLSSVVRESSASPSRSVMELATWIRDHLRPPVSGQKLGTEETGKQKPNKQREPLQKGTVQQIKIPVDKTNYTRRGL